MAPPLLLLGLEQKVVYLAKEREKERERATKTTTRRQAGACTCPALAFFAASR
jgi:hypothetical protein